MCLTLICDFSKWVNFTGLLLDVAGAFILIQFVLTHLQDPYKKNSDGSRTFPGESKKKKFIKGQEFYKPLALCLIIGGFVFQMISTLCK